MTLKDETLNEIFQILKLCESIRTMVESIEEKVAKEYADYEEAQRGEIK